MASIEWDEGSADETGIVGEAQFELWCAKTGLIPNRVSRDLRGSDFIVEFDGPASPWRLDQITCKVQVKTSSVDASSVNVKLDNFVRMASDLHPWFLVALSLDSEKEIRTAYVVHVDEALVERVHERVLGLAPGERLHKRMLKVSFSDSERLTPTSARAMAERIKADVGTSMWDYVSRKHSWHAALDVYQYVTGTCDIVANSRREAMEMMADLAIGAIERVPVESVRISGLPPEELGDGTGYFSVAERRSFATSIVAVEADGRIATLRCKTYHSKQFPHLTGDVSKWRFESTLLSIVVSDSDPALQWHITARDARYRLAELGATGNALGLLAQPNARVTFDVEGQRAFVAASSNARATTWPAPARRFAQACMDAAWIAGHLGLDMDTSVDPRLLEAQVEQLHVMRGVLDPRSSVPQVVVSDVSKVEFIGRDAVVVVCVGIMFEEIILLACVGLCGVLELASDRDASIAIRDAVSRPVATRCTRREEWKPGLTERLIATGVERFEAEGLVVITIDRPAES